MSGKSKQECPAAIRERYQSKLFDEFRAGWSQARQFAIGLLHRSAHRRHRRPRPK